MEHTREQILEVPCITCDAKAGESCTNNDRTALLIGFHKERVLLRQKYPVLPADLDATDKALITYYGFVMLCDSVSAHSEAIFGKGKQFSSVEVQRFFAHKAIVELRKDGLLK